MKWNDEWRMEIDDDILLRLAECRSKKSDMPIIAGLMSEYNPSVEVEECLDRTIEWICCWNDQFSLEPTVEEYNKILKKLLTNKTL